MDSLQALLAEAARAGVSRLADITRLDTLGIPVWQAIRPWSRSVSVHQGKGLDERHARVGACIEAIECAAAEAWTPPHRRRASVADMKPAGDAASPEDFSTETGTVGACEPIEWVPAARVERSGWLWVPFLAVSLDLSLAGHPHIRRTSSGLGGGFDLAAASLKGLCELIERDAFQTWVERPPVDRYRDEIAPESIDYSWFRQLRERFRDRGVIVRLFRLPSVVPVPAIAAELLQLRDPSNSRKHAVGTCVHPEPESALRGAVLEAAQARLGEIAGSRDDIDPGRAADAADRLNFALPAPPWLSGLNFHTLWREPAAGGAEAQLRALVEQLSAAGYDRVGRIELSRPDNAVTIVKLFAPGLGGLGRPRRAPVH